MDQVILDISSNQSFIFFQSEPAKLAKIDYLKVFRVFKLSITLMTLIVPTFLSFDGYYIKGTNCWECNFSPNLFLRNISWQFSHKTGSTISQKFLIVKISAKKPMVTMKI